MEAPKKLEEEDVKKFDFTRKELEYILENARFNEIQRKVFNRLTDIESLEEHISTATVSRIIKQIKKKILRLL